MKHLSQLVPSWKGAWIDVAYDEVAEGLRRERERLAGMRFLLIAFRREFDADGLMEHFDRIEGAATQADSEASAAQRARSAADRYGSPSWLMAMCDDSELAELRHPTVGVERVHYRGFKLADPAGINSVYCHFEVLQLSTKTTLGDELLSYLACQDALATYLRDVGRQPRAS